MKHDHSQIHGSIPYKLLRDLSIRPDEVIDFSATVNPFPLHKEITNAFCSIDYSAYPDNDCFEARDALTKILNVSVNAIALSSGLTEIIFTLPYFFKNPVCFVPTYSDYTAAFNRYGISVSTVSFPENNIELQTVINKIKQCKHDIVIICNPNNPTGNYLDTDQVKQICYEIPDCVICVDESYQELGENCSTVCSLINDIMNCIVLKSLSKPYGIGGVRAGYMVAPEQWCNKFRSRFLPWGVSTPAQVMVPVLVQLYKEYENEWRMIIEERNNMIARLEEYGYHCSWGRAPFFMVNTGDSHKLYLNMLTKEKMVVRSCVSFGMPEYIRIMPSLPKNNNRLIRALFEYKNK